MIPGNFDEGWSAGDLEPRGPAPLERGGCLTAPSGLRPVREPLLERSICAKTSEMPRIYVELPFEL
jgi:hypothetical protein